MKCTCKYHRDTALWNIYLSTPTLSFELRSALSTTITIRRVDKRRATGASHRGTNKLTISEREADELKNGLPNRFTDPATPHSPEQIRHGTRPHPHWTNYGAVRLGREGCKLKLVNISEFPLFTSPTHNFLCFGSAVLVARIECGRN